MPLLHSGAERYTLPAGTYTLGGRGPGALPLAPLECSPEVATIVVPASGESTIQRLAASVVVRLNQAPIGIAPKALANGVEIEFNGCRLTFTTDDAGDSAVPPASTGEEPDDDRLIPESLAFPQESTTRTGQAHLVNVRTGDATELSDCRVVVGRDGACDVVVPGIGVSRRHCSITPVEGGYLLRDESANGTLVNGSRVAGTYLLGHGDVVHIGDEELRFEVEGAVTTASSTPAAPTAILDVSRLRAEHATVGAWERAAAPLVANLEIVRGPYAGASFSIDRAVCSIGRSPESDVRIRDESISANHATLLRKGNTWFVVDLRSANGTFVDGLRIAGEREVISGSRLKLGRVELMFRALEGGVEIAIEKKRVRWWLAELLRPLFPRRSRGVPEAV
ncbi:MAG: FHA domain-containing protein [Gemmatimonadaceae bacterium]